MTTIKSYTDLEQSKKLAEILPLESADMHYSNASIEGINYVDEYRVGFQDYNTAIKILSEYITSPSFEGVSGCWSIVPCWSLAELLELIRHNSRYELEMWEGGYNFESGDIITEPFFDAIDVCVGMILKLHEQNIL